MLEAAVGTKEAPALTLLAENARYTRAVSVFPSLTPVCVSSIVTGAYPDTHRIPHLVWYHRGQQTHRRVRIVVRRDPPGGHAPVDPRRDPEHERRAPVAGCVDGLRAAGGRRPDDGRGQHHLLPRPHAAPDDDPRRHALGARPEALLLLQPLRVRRDRRARRVAQPLGGHDRRVRGRSRPLAGHARRLRLLRLLPVRLRLPLACARARLAAGGNRARRPRALVARRGGGRAGRVSRALRRPPLLRPRADARQPQREAAEALSRPRRRRRHRLEPRGHGLPPRELPAGRARARRAARPGAVRGSRRLPRRRSDRRPEGGGGARRAERRLSRTRTAGWTPLSATPTPARSSSRQLPATSLPTSAAATTRVAGATARSSRGTPRCRCCSPASRASRAASSTSRRSCCRTSVSDFEPERRAMVELQLRARDIVDERVLQAMETRPPRALRSSGGAAARVRGRGATDRLRPDHLPAVHGRAHLRGARAHGLGARARRRYRLRLPGRRARRARRRGGHDRAHPGARRRGEAGAGGGPATRTSRCASGTARSACPTARRSRRSRSRRRRPTSPRRSTSSSSPAGRMAIPVGRRRSQDLLLVVRSPEGPAVIRSVPCRFVPLLGEEGFD